MRMANPPSAPPQGRRRRIAAKVIGHHRVETRLGLSGSLSR
jgi:hypothetical protein